MRQSSSWDQRGTLAAQLADLAVNALIEEVTLTPKPALVDQRGAGAHRDLSFDLMCHSARSLRHTFTAIALASFERSPTKQLREELATLGRAGESTMLAVTRNVNTHRGAIWALGLLVAGAAMRYPDTSAATVARDAGDIARFPDQYAPDSRSHGSDVRARFGVDGARGEARAYFPHVLNYGLPTLFAARVHVPETHARLDALLAIMTHLPDTCLLYRAGKPALNAAQQGARQVLQAGGSATPTGWTRLLDLDCTLLAHDASPGGSADLFAATLFLDHLAHHTCPNYHNCENS